MSIILDALKKSESDQQRQTGPALFEVRVAPPKARFPVWAIAIVALLVINMLIVGYLLLRRQSHGEQTAATNTAATAMPAASAPATAANATPGAPTGAPAAGTAPTGGPVTGNPAMGRPATAALPPATPGTGSYAPSAAAAPPPAAAQASAPAYAGSVRPGEAPENPTGPAAASSERNGNEPTLADRAHNALAAEQPGNQQSANPDDYAPATEPDSPLFKGHVKRGTASGMPLYQDAAVAPGANMPQLRLDLHVYAAKPQDRFVLINMHRLREGDTLPEGVKVESITPDGVVLSHNGSQFMLPRE